VAITVVVEISREYLQGFRITQGSTIVIVKEPQVDERAGPDQIVPMSMVARMPTVYVPE
jgi:hypothetical protein